MSKVKIILGCSAVTLVLIVVYLVIPMSMDASKIADGYNNLDDSSEGFQSKSSFYDYINGIVTSNISDNNTSSSVVTSAGGQKMADMAKQEYDYYVANKLIGGFRYWYWFDLIRTIDGDNGTIENFYPLGSQYVAGGFYDQSALHGSNVAQWCDMFVSCVGQACGYTAIDIIKPGASCQSTFKTYADAGIQTVILNSSYVNDYKKGFESWVGDSIVGVQFVDSFDPQPGDLIFFSKSSKNGGITHIGIVYSVSDTVVTTIEGNVGSKTGNCHDSSVQIIERDRFSKDIAGYVRPAYTE